MISTSPRVASDAVVVGAGIVGLATARALLLARPGIDLVVVDKEASLGHHQTSRNSGVVHAGVYYPPGSLKARLCAEGRRRLEEYALLNHLPYQKLGKLVVAVTEEEAAQLPGLHSRAEANGVPGVCLLDEAELRAREPAIGGIAALYSPETAITDFRAIAGSYADDIRRMGGRIVTRFEVASLGQDAGSALVTSREGCAVRGREVVLCAGVWTERLARRAGLCSEVTIVPFRGDYFRLVSSRSASIRHLIYPVPDPRLPFLGVHVTPTVLGEVLLGPNAVLAAAREGYRWWDTRAGQMLQVAAQPGFRRLARAHWRTGLAETHRSWSRRAFAREARRLLPGLHPGELRRAPAGIRAQAIDTSGTLVDDFRIARAGRVTAVLNAPSPAATSSLALGDAIVGLLGP